MKTVLLVIFLFTTDPYGNPTDMEVVTQTFDTLEDCNYVGRNLRDLVDVDPDVKTLSYCVDESDYK